MATNNDDPTIENYFIEVLYKFNIFFHDLQHDLSYLRAFAENVKHLKEQGKLSDTVLDRLLDEIEEKTKSASTQISDLMSNRER